MSTKGWSAAGVQKWVASLETHMTHPVGKYRVQPSPILPDQEWSQKSGSAASHQNRTVGIISHDSNYIMQQQVSLLFETAVLSDIYLFPPS